MRFSNLLEKWSKQQASEEAPERYAVRLPMQDAARLEALAEMFPGTPVETLVTDLLSAALDEVESSMPYVAGSRVIREDEFGDPVYEDVGLTPRFLELTRAHRTALAGKG